MTLSPKPIKIVTKVCGCRTKYLDSGTLQTFCELHNMFKNPEPRVTYE